MDKSTYSAKIIASELKQTALGHSHYGNALRVAKDFPGITPEERSVLDKYAVGAHQAGDNIDLLEIAVRISEMEE